MKFEMLYKPFSRVRTRLAFIALIPMLGAMLGFAAGTQPEDVATHDVRGETSMAESILDGDGLATEADAPIEASLEPARLSMTREASFSSERARFDLRVRGTIVTYRVKALTALPGESVDLAVGEADAGSGPFRARDGSGPLSSRASGSWRWTAPEEPGIYPLEITNDADGSAVHLNVLVMHPSEHIQNESLHGYRIGEYRSRPLRGDPAYLPPTGFVEVAPEDHDVLVSPHFTLGQFLCKQPGDPRFVAFSEPLVEKLEAVLEAVNGAGHAAGTLHVMSGFRTPAYNLSIGNKTVYSRHLWGDAADVFVDGDGNGDMDDLNGDGRVNVDDGRVLYGIVERVEKSERARVRKGGLGLYRRNAVHGPFVHVDARGQAARW